MRTTQNAIIAAWLAACICISLAIEIGKAAEGETGRSKLVVLSEHQGPVIGPDHPDVKASKNRSGFETGEVIKHKGVYHMFVNEMFGTHHIDMRSSHWSSPDAVNWKRQSTVVDRVPCEGLYREPGRFAVAGWPLPCDL